MRLRPTSPGVFPLAALAGLTLCVSGKARAWDRDTHVTILQAALRLSPSAQARIPEGNLPELERTAAEPDPIDPYCRYHGSITGDHDPAGEAGRALERLLSGKGLDRPYLRAQAVGRFLHFVADAALPSGLLKENAPKGPELFRARRLTVFREPQALSRPLAAILRERGGAARWGDDSASASSAAFRLAVNLTIDALLLLPGPASQADDGRSGPVLFFADRLASGRGVIFYDPTSPRMNASVKAVLFTDYPGIQILEWIQKSGGSGIAVRALLFNNDDTCAAKLVLTVPTPSSRLNRLPARWQKELPGLPARSLRLVAFEVPRDLSLDGLDFTLAREPACSNPADTAGAVSTARRIIVNTAAWPITILPNAPETRVGK